MKWPRKAKQGSEGFSLVELVIVIAIMAILIAFLTPQFVRYIEKSRQSADLDTVEGIIKAVQVGISDTGLEFTDEGEIKIAGTGGSITKQTGSGIQKCMDNAGIDVGDVRLKSSEWGTVTIAISSRGVCTVSSDGTADMADRYKKQSTDSDGE